MLDNLRNVRNWTRGVGQPFEFYGSTSTLGASQRWRFFVGGGVKVYKWSNLSLKLGFPEPWKILKCLPVFFLNLKVYSLKNLQMIQGLKKNLPSSHVRPLSGTELPYNCAVSVSIFFEESSMLVHLENIRFSEFVRLDVHST